MSLRPRYWRDRLHQLGQHKLGIALGFKPEVWRLTGPFDSSYSLAIENRELALALSELGVFVTLQSRDGPGFFDPNPAFLSANPRIAAMSARDRGVDIPAVGLRNIYPPYADGMQGKLRGFACYAWEESEFPQQYVEGFNQHLDFVAVISRFVAKALRDSGVFVPIFIIGCGIDQVFRAASPPAGASLAERQAPGDKFCFLHISSCMPRKGIDVLLKAWPRAFAGGDQVQLVIKSTPNQHHDVGADVAAMRAAHPAMADIAVIDGALPESEIRALYERADAIVAPSRGEGFCLPLAEAFALGKPVITTAHGGPMDFCTPDNAWLCDYDFAYAESHVSAADSVWAEPRVDSLVQCLQRARSAPERERSHRGRLGGERILHDFTWRRVAERLRASVEMMRTPRPATRAGRIGWVSPWGQAGAIADYSRRLAQVFPAGRLAVFADRDAVIGDPDASFVVRCWQRGPPGSFAELYPALKSSDVDSVVIQFGHDLLPLRVLADLIDRLTDDGCPVYVVMHETELALERGGTAGLAMAKESLRRAKRLVVHSVHDLNRLKNIGVVDNVMLLPYGTPPAAASPDRMSTDRAALLASFGPLAPGKGFEQLIEAVGLLRAEFPLIHLRMLNSAAHVAPAHVAPAHVAIDRAIEAQGLRQHVTVDRTCLPDAEAVERLSQADFVVYPYQANRRSVSAAVRVGLASLRPVVTTPLTMFDDVAKVTHRLPGISAEDIAAGLARLLSATPRPEPKLRCREWVEGHAWPRISRRFRDMIDGLAAQDAGFVHNEKKFGRGVESGLQP